VPLKGLVDVAGELELDRREQGKLEKELARWSVNWQRTIPANAPPAVVNKERDKRRDPRPTGQDHRVAGGAKLPADMAGYISPQMRELRHLSAPRTYRTRGDITTEAIFRRRPGPGPGFVAREPMVVVGAGDVAAEVFRPRTRRSSP
jgi:hypothetical protein